jgi:hypothetical protein
MDTSGIDRQSPYGDADLSIFHAPASQQIFTYQRECESNLNKMFCFPTYSFSNWFKTGSPEILYRPVFPSPHMTFNDLQVLATAK